MKIVEILNFIQHVFSLFSPGNEFKDEDSRFLAEIIEVILIISK